jgi:formylglycine-generating enzyme required for sulfatase activity
MDSGSNSAAVSRLGAFTWSALRSACWLALVCAAFAACDSRAAVEEHTKETIRLLAEAKQRADALGSQPSDIPSLHQWLQDYEPWVRRLPEVEAQLAAVMQRAKPRVTPRLEVRGYDFASEADEEQARTLGITGHELRAIGSPSDPSHGLCGTVRQKLAVAQKAAAEVAAAAEAQRRDAESRAKAWDEAIAAIEKHERYGGMKLRVHEGLLPIGVDPESKLWEFVHVASGTPGKAIPIRDPATGRIVADGDMGIVLVLLPGGTFWMGAQKDDASKPNFDPAAQQHEGPVHQVTLSPFFVGKHEVTRGQWSRWSVGVQAGVDERSEALHARPVTEVSWNDVDSALRKVGLQLPTEAQWEYACRAGTSTPWWTGADARGVSRGGVVDDAPCASVGSKAANAFGVHDTSGNVMEWCRDGYGQYASAASVDPFLANGAGRVFRGGGCIGPVDSCRSAMRGSGDAGVRYNLVGFRVALAAGVAR